MSRRTGRHGNSLYSIARSADAALDEATFVDAVAARLRRGEFLLLICGDGIREDVESIAEYLDPHGTLHFTFGLVEVAVFESASGSRFIQPRVVARTEIVRRTVVDVRDGVTREADDEPSLADESTRRALDEVRRFYLAFWERFIERLVFDDVTQDLPTPSRGTHIDILMPSETNAWVTIYLAGGSDEIGVFLTFGRGVLSDRVIESLRADRVAIESELGGAPEWHAKEDGKYSVERSRTYRFRDDDVVGSAAQAWLLDYANRFVNVFRYRLRDIAARD